MTTPKHCALQALADATERPFLANAPLMAIVEAVQVLDEAGLLASGAANAPATDAARALREYPNASAAAEEAMRNGIAAALKQHDEGDLRDHLQLLLDRVEVTDAALVMCELLDDAEKAKAVLDDEGFQGRTLDAQVRALIMAWSDERDEARRLRRAAYVAPDEPAACPKCGKPMTPSGICLNFPACPDALIPF